jgi:hypothetical protein
MPPASCAICDTPLTAENDSREHIILNALGGRRAVSGFICTPCNNTSGHTWDAALAKQLNPLCLFFHIYRQDGEPPAQNFPTISGDTMRVSHDGLALPRPTISRTPTGAGTNIQVVARTPEEAREILTGLKRKYPQIDVDTTLASATSTYSYLSEPVKMELKIGGPDGGRSIVKSAFALAVSSGVAPSDCDEAKRYIASGEDACFGYFNDFDLIEGRPENTVVHCTAVSSTDDGLLLGYVELFTVFRMFICLGSNYRGKPISAVYAIDPVTGSELNVTVRLKFSREELADIYAYKHVPFGPVAKALETIMPDAMRRSFEREKEVVIERALKDAWSKLDLPPDTILTKEHLLKLSGLLAERMMPFLRHNAQRRGNSHQKSIAVPPKDRKRKDS